MVSIPKVVGLLSCGFLLCLGLSNVASSADELKTRPSDEMNSGSAGDTQSGKTIKGKVLRIEGDNYFVKNREDGKEVRLHVDDTTQKNAVGITAGDNIMAKINDQNHVFSILTDQSQSTILRDKALQDLK